MSDEQGWERTFREVLRDLTAAMAQQSFSPVPRISAWAGRPSLALVAQAG